MADTNFSLAMSMFLLSLVIAVSADGYGYGPKPKVEKPKADEKLLPLTTGIQGLIYCKSGPKLFPLAGAVARITCLSVDQDGYESAPFSILTHPADAKGYFFATLSSFPQLKNGCKLTECKAFLESSPWESCKVPTDVNQGISGAHILTSKYALFKNIKLHSIGPFIYTPESKPVTNGY
ncbi:hypothetical protein RJ639_016375 [Escallonia herrerae]|uniref:Uncharacterized protein n=1 Tax=Escallonia herrerae TaxID=1293975 RepID=A0AA89AIN0_9ASTE|nr:hypothetical protein RJ639_016375 [Escallonia herrerae]